MRHLLADAGFHDVHIRPQVMTIRLPPEEEFVLKHLAATPVADAVAALGEETRLALAREVRMALQSYVDGEGVAFPNEAHLATAHT